MKTRILVSLCLVVTLLCSCATPAPTPTLVEFENYKIYEENGKWYLEDFPDNSSETEEKTDSSENSSNASIGVMFPQFNTISEMREAIIGGTLSGDQITALRVYTGNEDDPLEIYDPYEMRDLAAPNDIKYDYVLLEGECYSFQFEGSDFLGYIVCCDKEAYEKTYQNKYGITKNQSIISETTVSERDARVVHSETGAGEFKDIFYTITTKHGDTLYVKEQYDLSYFDETRNDKVSETIPQSIRLFGNNGTNYYYGWFKGFEERPSVKWLQSFGLVS